MKRIKFSVLTAALHAEIQKLRHSKIPLITALAFIALPAMIALAASGTLVNSGAGVNVKDWSEYLALVFQSYSGAAVLGMGFVTSWLFGREFSDRTVKDLLALPMPREAIVIAKFIVMQLWCVMLSLLTLGTAIAFGYIFNIVGDGSSVIWGRLSDFGILIGFMSILSTPIALLASTTKGYLAPIGVAVAAVLVAQFAGGLGIGAYFPWQIPSAYLAAVSGSGQSLSFISYAIMYSTGIVGVLGTLAWWRYSDQT